jgi:hypothetical protein
MKYKMAVTAVVVFAVMALVKRSRARVTRYCLVCFQHAAARRARLEETQEQLRRLPFVVRVLPGVSEVIQFRLYRRDKRNGIRF